MSKAAVFGAYLSRKTPVLSGQHGGGKTHRLNGAAEVLGLAVATKDKR